MLPRGATIGILGDGQLGRMIAHAAQRRGFRVHGFGQDRHSPLGQVTAYFTEAGFDDVAALDAFAKACHVITSEFENVPIQTLQRVHCLPSADIFAAAQDRLLEKQTAQRFGLQPAQFFAIDDLETLKNSLEILGGHGVLKTRRLGYDGKGQWRLKPDTSLNKVWETTPKGDLILEEWVQFDFETSGLVARNGAGETRAFPCGENRHRAGVLHQSIVPGKVTADLEARVQATATQLAVSLGLQGLLAIEFFVRADGGLIYNEMAPRPHNSGHWTMEGCTHSQFDLLIDALTGAPLARPVQRAPTIMTNLLGDEIKTPPKGQLHDYGKASIQQGRKMGHVTKHGPQGR